MSFFDILGLALRNLREAKLRAALTTMGVVIGVAVIVTMTSFGLGLQRNTVERFKNLDLFNEVQVFGRDLNTVLESQLDRKPEPASEGGENKEPKKPGNKRQAKSSERPLTDAALGEIAALPGVAYVEPTVRFSVYARANDRVRQELIGGVRVPNGASRFQHFAAGQMLGAKETDAAIVDESFISEHGFKQAADAIGQRIEFLAPPDEVGSLSNASRRNEGGAEQRASGKAEKEAGISSSPTRRADDTAAESDNTTAVLGEATAETETDEPLTFFGLPLEDAGESSRARGSGLVARTFRIVGVLKNEVEKGSGGNRRFRGMMPAANIYIPLRAANEWKATHRGMMEQVALQLARRSGLIDTEETEGYQAATVRVSDPAAMKNVVERLRESGFNVFGLFTELDEIRTFFLIVNATLGLLGGISLLVASFGIANTMIMSILERTREIGIMMAVGAEDREIKLIFFVEAAVIGLMGGVVGALAAWSIDKLSNRLAYQFILAPRGEPFIDFFSLPPYLWLGAILFAMAVAVAAALYPAARAARIDPVKALRHD